MGPSALIPFDFDKNVIRVWKFFGSHLIVGGFIIYICVGDPKHLSKHPSKCLFEQAFE